MTQQTAIDFPDERTEREKRLANSSVLKEFPTLESIMFQNKKAIARHKKKKFWESKKLTSEPINEMKETKQRCEHYHDGCTYTKFEYKCPYIGNTNIICG
jgi:hypothetical protein